LAKVKEARERSGGVEISAFCSRKLESRSQTKGAMVSKTKSASAKTTNAVDTVDRVVNDALRA
jgi:hypothetical protein